MSYHFNLKCYMHLIITIKLFNSLKRITLVLYFHGKLE